MMFLSSIDVEEIIGTEFLDESDGDGWDEEVSGAPSDRILSKAQREVTDRAVAKALQSQKFCDALRKSLVAVGASSERAAEAVCHFSAK
jgi:hypothetical protein